ncbi:uncharacterized protein M6B38_261915 [Iris pallida]|uniref:CCT domain-containing protein n=1 Tax=Iris pallida TaxID=29817 RepID=A0AAX6ICV5_IRIPA|nr:uncharacterized protein M6B38_261915 [Iris pallida]
MYAEAELMFPLLQGFPQQLISPYQHHHHQDQEAFSAFTTDLPTTATDHGTHMGSLLRTSSVSEYDLGGEGDLFKAPEPIIEEPVLAVDPIFAAMTIISNGEDAISETIKAADMESIQNEHLNNIFYDCKKDLLEKFVIGEVFPELRDVKFPPAETEEVLSSEKFGLSAEGQILKSVSTGCLNSMDWIGGGCTTVPNFLDFEGMDFETAFGLRRAYSEGDIQALGITNTNNGNTSSMCASFGRQLTSDLKTEERQEKLSRYRKKKNKRDFGRKIKYACRKALADNQPRVRGRFAKTEECEVSTNTEASHKKAG